MSISIRIPSDKENKINQLARKRGMTKTAIILEAIDEKLGLNKDRAATIRDSAGWMKEQEVQQLRRDLSCFDEIHEKDWP